MQIRLLKKQIEILKKLIELLLQLLRLKKKKGYEAFRLALKKAESGNDYQIVNALGYLGAYQFGMARLTDLGYAVRKANSVGYANECFEWKPQYSKASFLGDHNWQDRIFDKHIADLLKRIEGPLDIYIGQTLQEIPITLSGLVAGAHLGGIGGIKRFLKFGTDTSDALGTSIGDYIKRFAGYNLKV